MDLTDSQFHRYARHLILDEVGEEGQEKLLESRVLVVGAGGLGSPLLLYLAAAGVGTLGVIDDDVVELSNLQRQVIHKTASLDQPKVDSARATVAEINPDVRIVPHRTRLTAANAAEILAGYDLVADGSDNFATRFLLNDACYFARIPLVSAALLRFDGQLSTYKAHLGGAHPCYRCLFPTPPPADLIPRCEEAGILGAIAGAVGSLQAVEVLKELLGLGESLSGSLLVYDGLATTFRKIRLKRDPACPLCGPQATIRDLSGHGTEHPLP
ncbi:molybdopterin-synthase adenylyltransferase MoeB [Rhodospirillaceae bacterium SYSU D60014]|uniref:HesA/MoeB/ThiF family protein n=1 Tax=Virgifigura deserti TaxID=2268457 RepID=UPI000E674556